MFLGEFDEELIFSLGKIDVFDHLEPILKKNVLRNSFQKYRFNINPQKRKGSIEVLPPPLNRQRTVIKAPPPINSRTGAFMRVRPMTVKRPEAASMMTDYMGNQIQQEARPDYMGNQKAPESMMAGYMGNQIQGQREQLVRYNTMFDQGRGAKENTEETVTRRNPPAIIERDEDESVDSPFIKSMITDDHFKFYQQNVEMDIYIITSYFIMIFLPCFLLFVTYIIQNFLMLFDCAQKRPEKKSKGLPQSNSFSYHYSCWFSLPL